MRFSLKIGWAKSWLTVASTSASAAWTAGSIFNRWPPTRNRGHAIDLPPARADTVKATNVARGAARQRRGEEPQLKPAAFAYAKARSIDHAVELLSPEGARVLAGGQSLIATLNMRLDTPSLLVDINGISALLKNH